MREKTIEQKFRLLRPPEVWHLSSHRPVLMGCLTESYFSPVGRWRLWRSRHRGKSPAPCSWHGTGFYGSWGLRCMFWMMSHRLEG